MADAVVYKLHDSDTPLALSTGDGLTFLKELIHVGQFKKDQQEFAVDDALLTHWKRTFDEMATDGVRVPVPTQHSEDPEHNRGRVVSMRLGKNSRGKHAIFGVFKFRDAEAAKMAGSADVSVYVPPFRKNGHGKRYVRPIAHVALTDYPVIPGLDEFTPIAASLTMTKENKKMSMATLAEKLALPTADKTEEQLEADVLLLVKDLQAQVASLGGGDEGEEAVVASLLRDNRTMKIDVLAGQKRITPAQATMLKEQFCGEEALALSLSGGQDAFDSTLKTLALNEPLKLGKERSGPQTRTKDDDNPLLRDAARRKAAAGHK